MDGLLPSVLRLNSDFAFAASVPCSCLRTVHVHTHTHTHTHTVGKRLRRSVSDLAVVVVLITMFHCWHFSVVLNLGPCLLMQRVEWKSVCVCVGVCVRARL